MNKPQSLFHEEQGLAPKRVRIVLLTVPVIFVLSVIWQVVLHHTWGQRMSNGSLIFWTVFLWLIYLRLITVKLVTDLWQDKLSIVMRGLWRVRNVPLDRVEDAQVVTFDAAKDYGGYGIRTAGRTKAYIAAGERGVSLKLAKGSTVVVGSQRPDQLARAIHAAIAGRGPAPHGN